MLGTIIEVRVLSSLLNKRFPTDNSLMSLTIAKTFLESKIDWNNLFENAVKSMRNIGGNYPNCGYGDSFYGWIFSEDPKSYKSYGNGDAIQLSAVGLATNSVE